MNPLYELLGDVGHVLDTPGAYLRGALGGRPGERMGGQDLLGSYGVDGGPLGGLAADVLLDPTLLAGVGAGALGARALSRHADSANPLLRFLGDESGALDWDRFAERFRREAGRARRVGDVGRAREHMMDLDRFRSAGPADFFAEQGQRFEDLPAVKLDRWGEQLGVPVDWASRSDIAAASAAERVRRGIPDESILGDGGGVASYIPWEGPHQGKILLPDDADVWADSGEMRRFVAEQNAGSTPFFSTSDPDHLPVHELVHALHDRSIGDPDEFYRLLNAPGLPAGAAARYGDVNPLEYVAEAGASGVLQGPLAGGRPTSEFGRYAEFGGPLLDELLRAVRGR